MKASSYMAEFDLWLKKARADLVWTKHNIDSSEFYGACFSGQQAAEKALKAYLLYHKKPLRKIHDVLALLEDCVSIDKNFEVLRKYAKLIFPYYVETRYPFGDDLVSFDRQKADEAHQAAERIIEFVERKIA